MTSRSYEQIALQPNLRTDIRVGRNPQECRLIKEVMRVAHELWPNKTAQNLASRAGVDTRTAERWLAFRTGISGPALAALIASDDGLKFIEAVIVAQGKGLPAFWRRFKRKQDRIRVETEMRQLKLRLEKLEADEDAE